MANSLSLLLWPRVAGFFAWVRTVWSPWILAPLPTWFVSSCWGIVLCYLGNGDYRGYRLFRHERDLDLVMDALERYGSPQILRLDLQGAKEPSRRPPRRRISRRCREKALWKP